MKSNILFGLYQTGYKKPENVVSTYYKKLPFLKKLTVLTMLVTLPILLILVLVGIGFVKHNNKNALKNKIETVNQITVVSIIPDLLFQDIEAVKLTLQNIKHNSDVEYVCIQSNQTKVITSLGKVQNILYKDYLKY
ncbi:MAG: hypothetical protein AB8G11_19405 [Saprospiraceae bacterium]